MAKKKRKPTLGKMLLRLIIGIPVLMNVTANLRALIGFEMRSAGRSLLSLIIFAVICALLLTASWICLLAMLFFYLASLQWSTQMILLLLFGLNFVMLFFICMLMSKYKKKLTFPETRRLLRELTRL